MKNLTFTQEKPMFFCGLKGGLTALMILIIVNIFSQTPQAFKYQAVVRNSVGDLISEENVSVAISILQNNPSGAAVYSETHSPITTNEFGIINLEIGTGSVVDGNIANIDWGSDTYFLQIHMDENGGPNYQLMGTSQLLSVPYSQYSESTASLNLPYSDELTSSTSGFQITLEGPASAIKGISFPDGTIGTLGDPNYGVYGTGWAKFGYLGGMHYAVYGNGLGNIGYLGSDEIAVYGENNTGAKGYIGGELNGIYGESSIGHAGYFEGKGYFKDNLGIGTTNPDASAMLEINSNSKGFLPPQLTTMERDAISSPADGLIIFNTTTNCLEFYATGYWNQTCGTADVPTVTNPTTGETWMDRNLGASQVATSSTDAAAYGDLYQWGRLSDGHESRTSSTSTILSATDEPGHGDFILAPASPSDWRSPQNDNLWQGTNGLNNPCPHGFRIPTEAEWDAERLSWASNDAAGAFGSPLKLTIGGTRHYSNGGIFGAGSFGTYLSSSVSGVYARGLAISSGGANLDTAVRAYGMYVRCIKD